MKAGLELMPFQKDAAEWLTPRRTGMVVGDPGVGKTPIACAASRSAERILVFCPPIATSVWSNHFRDWTDIKDIRVAEFADGQRPNSFVSGHGVRIIGYSRARSDAGLVTACKSASIWDVLILDEVHALKNPGAERTKAIYGKRIDCTGSVAENARHVWCLSGTPLLNHSAEFWTHLRALAPEAIQIQGDARPMSYDEFVQRYANAVSTPFGWQVTGSKRADELAAKVKPFIRRIRLKEVLKDMPELRIVETPLPKVETRTTDYDFLDDDDLLAAGSQPGTGLSTARRELGEIKAPLVAEFVADQLEDAPDDKIIVFAHHQNVIHRLAIELRVYKPLVIDGSTPSIKRVGFIETFQTDPRFRLIILAIDAAGEAITLTAARHVIFAESSWTPARNSQAIARAYRRGQKNAVLARFMTLPGTLDERIMQVLADKARAIARVVDNERAEPQPLQQAQFPTI